MTKGKSEASPAKRQSEWIGLALLACALIFNSILLAPELSIGRVPLNDLVFHLSAAERLEESLVRHEPFLEPWVSEWACGYPIWRSYQPLGHLLGAIVLRLSEPFASHSTAFAALHYLLIVLLPASIYAGTRLFGLKPAAAGLASLFIAAPTAAGEAGRYGLSYGATVWRGTGLFTQVLALHLLIFSFGIVTRAIDSGRKRILGAVLLACTLLSHIVFGYVAFVSAFLFAIAGPKGERAQRLIRLIIMTGLALILVAWFVVPLFLARPEVNHSRWEAPFKWDSFGAPYILSELFAGRLLDSGRPPILSCFLLAAVITAFFSIRETLPRRIIVLTLFWLILFFGRTTWGHLLLLVGVPRDFHLHRLQGAFEIAAIMLIGWGLERLIAQFARVNRLLSTLAVVLVATAVISLGIERAAYLKQNRMWGEANLAAFTQENKNLDAAIREVRKILAAKPGRVSAGKAASWGKQFKVGSTPVYAFLTREHFDQVSFLYHAMSLPSDVMVLRDENHSIHDSLFGVRVVLAPAGQRMPPHLRLRALHGKFAVYESSHEGYFSLVDVGARYTGPPATYFEPNSTWINSALAKTGVVVALGTDLPGIPPVGRWETFPKAQSAFALPRGRIISEEKVGEIYKARVVIDRECYVSLKVTWFPDLKASVNGLPASVIRVTPGFVVIPVSAGEHQIAVRYAPSSLKLILFLTGIPVFAFCSLLLRRPRSITFLNSAGKNLGKVGERLVQQRGVILFVLAALVILSMRPLFRGQLIEGHDALAYPPGLMQMEKALRDGHFPPVWAADLESGHGQPLFQFTPPIIPGLAVFFHTLGLRITDSLQISLALLFAAGAASVYLLCRRQNASQFASIAVSSIWLFAPFISLTLFVRAAFTEAAGVALTPVALLTLFRAMDGPSIVRIAVAAVAIASIGLADISVAVLTAPVFVVFILLRIRNSTRSVRSVTAGAVALVAGLCLSAYFWIPFFLEFEYIRLAQLRNDFQLWSQHLVSPVQLLWSKWSYGYSEPGPHDEMSFRIGAIHGMMGVAGFLIARRTGNTARREEAIAFAILAAAGSLLATHWSAPVWLSSNAFRYVAFPWCALILPALFLSLLSVHAFEHIGARNGIAIALLFILIHLPQTEPKGYLIFDDEYYWPNSIAQQGITTTSLEVYDPKWVEIRPQYSKAKLASSHRLIHVQEIKRSAFRQEFIVESETDTTVETSTFYYPGWIALINNKEVSIGPAQGSGNISLGMPKGAHRVVLQLRQTTPRRISLMVSIATIAILVIAVFLSFFRKFYIKVRS